jgi:hypothetical protein
MYDPSRLRTQAEKCRKAAAVQKRGRRNAYFLELADHFGRQAGTIERRANAGNKPDRTLPVPGMEKAS